MALTFENPKQYIAELIGTAILIFIGCVAGTIGLGGGLITPFAFAIVFIGLVYCIGELCDCHFNPLISLSMLITGRMKGGDTLFYILAQIVGGIVGAILAFYILTQFYYTGNMIVYPSVFGQEYAWGRYLDWVGAFFMEMLFAFVLCYVALKATESKKIDMKAGIIIAVAMFGLIYIGSILTCTAVNPAKSIGAAIAMMFSDIDGKFDPLIQLWMFIIAPAIGAVVASVVYLITSGSGFDLNAFIASKKKTEPVEESVEETADEPLPEEAESDEEPIADEPVEETEAVEETAEEAPAEDVVIEAEPEAEDKE